MRCIRPHAHRPRTLQRSGGGAERVACDRPRKGCARNERAECGRQACVRKGLQRGCVHGNISACDVCVCARSCVRACVRCLCLRACVQCLCVRVRAMFVCVRVRACALPCHCARFRACGWNKVHSGDRRCICLQREAQRINQSMMHVVGLVARCMQRCGTASDWRAPEKIWSSTRMQSAPATEPTSCRPSRPVRSPLQWHKPYSAANGRE